ncbi:MAG TPA: fluoride efflux transporter CrcB [Tepidisphaeraceae bacterium]
MQIYKVVLIGVGGAVGTLARYGLGGAVHSAVSRSVFPFGTLIINLLGCLIMGYLQGLFVDRWILREDYRLALLVGFLGGFTTFSSYGWETTSMLQDHQFVRAGVNVLVSNVVGIGLVMAGFALSRVKL